MSAALKRFALFGDLGDDEISLLSELLEPFAVEPGEPLVQLGDRADGLVLLSEGSVRLAEAPGDAGPFRLEAPAVIGGASLVTLGQRPATWLADEACAGWTLSRTSFHRFSDDAPRAALRVLEVVTRDLAALVRSGIQAKR